MIVPLTHGGHGDGAIPFLLIALAFGLTLYFLGGNGRNQEEE
jgi:hypothetical protein